MRTKLLLSLLICFFMARVNVNAQIVYTDIDDGIPSGIDFNGDGTFEFDITQGVNPGDYIQYFDYGADNNIHALGTIETTDWDVPDCVDEGFTIDASNQWEGQGDCSLNAWGGENPSITVGEDEYLAVRFNLEGSDVYYGWIRFVMDASGNVTYKDYAYESTPNTSIDAGDATLSVSDFELDQAIVLYPNPAKDIVTIQSKSNAKLTKITVFDLLGKKVKDVSGENTIDVSNLNEGVYMVILFNDGAKIGSQKLVIN